MKRIKWNLTETEIRAARAMPILRVRVAEQVYSLNRNKLYAKSAGDIEPIKHSAFKQPQPQFEEFDRGKPYTVQIDRPKQVDGE
jgi:hypothetical protein